MIVGIILADLKQVSLYGRYLLTVGTHTYSRNFYCAHRVRPRFLVWHFCYYTVCPSTHDGGGINITIYIIILCEPRTVKFCAQSVLIVRFAAQDVCGMNEHASLRFGKRNPDAKEDPSDGAALIIVF
jgi:hypothetical protein